MFYPLQALMNTQMSSLIAPPNTLPHTRTIRMLILSLFGPYWLVLMHFPWPNSSDYGMNLLSWSVISLLGLMVWLFQREKRCASLLLV